MTTQYADYTYYTVTYSGTAITDESSFNRLALVASHYVDNFTVGRAEDEEDADNVNLIKMAVCALSDEIFKLESGEEVGIKSERIGDHSVTYAEDSVKSKTQSQVLEKTAKIYLGLTGLMFKGFQDGEYGSGLLAQTLNNVNLKQSEVNLKQ